MHFMWQSFSTRHLKRAGFNGKYTHSQRWPLICHRYVGSMFLSDTAKVPLTDAVNHATNLRIELVMEVRLVRGAFVEVLRCVNVYVTQFVVLSWHAAGPGRG